LVNVLDHPSTEDTIVTESIRALANLSQTSTFAEMLLLNYSIPVARVIHSISGTDSLSDWEIEATIATYLPSSIDPLQYKQEFLSSYNRDDNFNYESVRLLANLLENASGSYLLSLLPSLLPSPPPPLALFYDMRGGGVDEHNVAFVVENNIERGVGMGKIDPLPLYKMAGNPGVTRNLVQFLKSLNVKLQFVAIKAISFLSVYGIPPFTH
jgi:hypothetical protein